jgi:hypothetical protein
MTPKEKAWELFMDMKFEIPYVHDPTEPQDDYIAKKCALIAVEFAMNSKYSFQPMHGGWVSGKSYYEEVKQEIEKL